MVRTSYSQQQPLCFQSCIDCTQGSRTVHGHKSEHTDFLSSSAATVSEGFFLSNLQVKKIKQIFFHWRFKVCALTSSLLTTNFLYAFHRDLQTAGKKEKKKHSETLSDSRYSNFYTLDECHRVTIYQYYQATFFTRREQHFHHNTFSNSTLIPAQE